MAVSADYVKNAYQVLLLREADPEGLRHHLRSDNEDVLLQNMLGSAEFRHRRPALAAPDVWVWVDTQLGFRLRVNLADSNVSRDVLRNEFEPLETKLVLETVREGDTVLDIGANIGFYTNLLANRVGVRGRVHAFEALPFLAEQVQASVYENRYQDRVTVHCAALSDREGEAKMIFSEGGNWGGAHLANTQGPLPGQIEKRVPVQTLNALPKFERLEFIKMDVEGAEPLVIRPFRSELARLRPIILSELHPEQLRRVSDASPSEFISLLSSVGYVCCRIDSCKAIKSYDAESVISVAFRPAAA